MCPLCWPLGMGRGSELAGLPAKGALLRPERAQAKHNSMTGHRRGVQRGPQLGRGWPPCLPLRRLRNRFHGTAFCCPNKLGMARAWAVLLAGAETGFLVYPAPSAFLEGLLWPGHRPLSLSSAWDSRGLEGVALRGSPGTSWSRPPRSGGDAHPSQRPRRVPAGC